MNRRRSPPPAASAEPCDPWLTSREAQHWIDSLSAAADDTLAQLTKLRLHLTAQRAGWVVLQVELRRRAEEKFPSGAGMFFTRVGLEQATDAALAACKAARFPDGGVVADLCCGIGGDLRALADRAAVLAVDRDPHTALLAAANSGRAACPVQALAADAGAVRLAAVDAWHCDPDRRAGGGRSTRLERHSPSQDQLDRWLDIQPHAAIKLAPATQPPQHWMDRGECEWLSRRGQCRQLVVWFGRLAHAPGQRRATLVDDRGQPLVSLTGGENRLPAVAERLGRFVYDPDPAVLAAGLQGMLAARFELAAVAAGVGYLTGDRAVSHPALEAFEVLEQLPMDDRQVRTWIRQRDIGTLELKQRGTRLDLDRFRRQLAPRGQYPATLILTPLASRVVVLHVRRVLPPT